MVAFRNSDTRPILGRGPSILLRFVFFALLAFALMWLDQRQGYLERVRYGLSLAAYPLQLVVNSPGAGWDWLEESFSTRGHLQRENTELKEHLRDAEFRLMRLTALEQENLRLRSMREATTGIADRVMVAGIMRVDLNPLRHRVILSKGARDGVFKGQPLLDANGVFGQITRAGAFTSEAILISDTEHAIPVQVNRNGLRSIAVGTGDLSRLSLPFLPVTADIEVGDLLISSGLGGVFPPGYPVATVTEVNKDTAQTLATISARPAALLDRDREVLLVWVREPPPDFETASQPAPAARQPAPTPPAPTPPALKPQSAPPPTPRPEPARPDADRTEPAPPAPDVAETEPAEPEVAAPETVRPEATEPEATAPDTPESAPPEAAGPETEPPEDPPE